MSEQHESPEYRAPTIRSLGSVAQLTQQSNKIGSASDAFTAVNNGALVGDLHPIP